MVREGLPVIARAGACAVALGLALAGCTGSAPPARFCSGGVTAALGPPGGGLSPAQVWAAYHLGPLLRGGIDGKGQTIVVVEPFGSPTIRHDLAVFDSGWVCRRPRTPGDPARGRCPRFRRPERGPAPPVNDPGRGMGARNAPGDHSAGRDAGRQERGRAVSADRRGRRVFIKHHLGGVISQSFGATEPTFRSRAALVQLRGAYRLAARPGYRVTVIAATGDSGAAGLTNSTRSFFKTPQVSWPASDPLVTAVGGTQLSLARGGIARARRGLAGQRRRPVSGLLSARLSRQRGERHRASPRNPRHLHGRILRHQCGGIRQRRQLSREPPGLVHRLRTSLAAPMFAGIVALADQEARHTLGAINPALYTWRPAMTPASWTSDRR